MPKKIILTGHNLDINDVSFIAQASSDHAIVQVDKLAQERMQKSRDFVFKIVEKGEPVYGINTGFGALSNKHIEKKDLVQLQINLIRSHCTGVGETFSKEVVRAIMLLRANCLTQGNSGVNPEFVDLLCDFLNFHITPIVPQKGSVGASGDLAPLSHIALSLIGEGQVEFEGKIISSLEAIKKINKKPIVPGPKDGLALINGTAVMSALGCLAAVKAKNLMKLADICSCITNEAVRGTSSAYDSDISQLKPHKGQLDCSLNLNALLRNSEIRNSHLECDKVQDPYSLRCVPQVHGACRQTLYHANEVLAVEINSVTDNPLIFAEQNKVVSGGNFHGEALAFCMDYLAMGLAEICNICERRIEKMMNPVFSELPPFLVKDSGLNSGLMIAHVTAAALTSDNKVLCHPSSVDSIPTSTDKEDHVSMGVGSGRKLHQVLENVEYCLAIELLCNTQALEFLRPLKSNEAIEKVHQLIRQYVRPIDQDRVFNEDIEKIRDLVSSNEIINTVESSIGALK